MSSFHATVRRDCAPEFSSLMVYPAPAHITSECLCLISLISLMTVLQEGTSSTWQLLLTMSQHGRLDVAGVNGWSFLNSWKIRFSRSHLSLFLFIFSSYSHCNSLKKDHDSISHRETELTSLPPQLFRVVCMRVLLIKASSMPVCRTGAGPSLLLVPSPFECCYVIVCSTNN